jgi:integrase
MDGYVARKGNRWYAVIYHGLDPITGKEQRSWHAAGTDRADAERLAQRLAKEAVGRDDAGRSLTFGAYLTQRWLPRKKLTLRPSTFDSYRRKVERHILPVFGATKIRALTHLQLNAFYEHKLRPTNGDRPLSAKSVLELHVIIRGALGDAHRTGVVTRNVAAVATAPRLRSAPPFEPKPWTEPELRAFLRAAADHRLYPAFRLAAATGMRRSELLGLKCSDVDWELGTVSINRGLVCAGYELHETRCKTKNSRRPVELDATTLDILRCWHDWQHATNISIENDMSPWMFPSADGGPIHPHAFSQAFDRLVQRSGLPVARLHDLRHTHATLLIKDGIPVKVVSERLGHARASFTMDTYQSVLPGMQQEAAVAIERITRQHPVDRAPRRRAASTATGR